MNLYDELEKARFLRNLMGAAGAKCVKTDQEVTEQFIVFDEARRNFAAALEVVKLLDKLSRSGSE